VQSANAPDQVTRAILIGVNLGPNLSITDSLATNRGSPPRRGEGHAISAIKFLKLELVVTPPALLLALVVVIIRVTRLVRGCGAWHRADPDLTEAPCLRRQIAQVCPWA
jgi:hypothetical protein